MHNRNIMGCLTRILSICIPQKSKASIGITPSTKYDFDPILKAVYVFKRHRFSTSMNPRPFLNEGWAKENCIIPTFDHRFTKIHRIHQHLKEGEEIHIHPYGVAKVIAIGRTEAHPYVSVSLEFSVHRDGRQFELYWIHKQLAWRSNELSE
jgi:hypothetical protein